MEIVWKATWQKHGIFGDTPIKKKFTCVCVCVCRKKIIKIIYNIYMYMNICIYMYVCVERDMKCLRLI